MKHFADPNNNNNLHIYSKNPRRYFITKTKNVCSEENWGTNPYFKNKRAIELYLNSIEPYWNACVDNIINLQNDKMAKVILSGYIAVLAACTPASVRIGADWHSKVIEHILMMLIRQKQENPGSLPDLPPLPENLEKFIDKGNLLKAKIDPKYSHAVGISLLNSTHWNIYKSDWLILINDTDNLFLTSDFPVTYYYPDQNSQLPYRFVPISPRIGMLITPNLKEEDHNAPRTELESWPETEVQFSEIKPKYPKIFNTLTVKSAERFVISSQKKEWISQLVEKYKDWRMEDDTVKIPTSQSGTYFMSRRRPRAVIEEKTAATTL